MRLSIPAPRILDFDIENRPLSYYGSDLTTAEVTAIAASWSDESFVSSWILGELSNESNLIDIHDDANWGLRMFADCYNYADIVTGHYIRKHDLPILNGAMVEAGLPTLGPKLTIDTKLDLIKWSFEAQPKSQQELALALGIEAPKVPMSQQDWRQANRLTPEGLEKTRERVVGDVKQHKLMRAELHRRGLLGSPKVWRP